MTQQSEIIDVIFFDSGVGGLTVLEEVRSMLPALRLAYVADTAGLPYGDKPAEWLVARTIHVIDKTLEKLRPRLLVVACNTASTLVLPALRQRYHFPIVGVVPAIKPAALKTMCNTIGLLATPATIKRDYIDRLVQEFAPRCQVIKVGSSELVVAAEQKLRGEALPQELFTRICAAFIQHEPQPDVIVLGCTHFPLLKTELKQVLPSGTLLLDSGKAVAMRVKDLLGDQPGQTTDGKGPPSGPAFFTSIGPEKASLEIKLKTYGLGSLDELLADPIHPFTP